MCARLGSGRHALRRPRAVQRRPIQVPLRGIAGDARKYSPRSLRPHDFDHIGIERRDQPRIATVLCDPIHVAPPVTLAAPEECIVRGRSRAPRPARPPMSATHRGIHAVVAPSPRRPAGSRSGSAADSTVASPRSSRRSTRASRDSCFADRSGVSIQPGRRRRAPTTPTGRQSCAVPTFGYGICLTIGYVADVSSIREKIPTPVVSNCQ